MNCIFIYFERKLIFKHMYASVVKNIPGAWT